MAAELQNTFRQNIPGNHIDSAKDCFAARMPSRSTHYYCTDCRIYIRLAELKPHLRRDAEICRKMFTSEIVVDRQERERKAKEEYQAYIRSQELLSYFLSLDFEWLEGAMADIPKPLAAIIASYVQPYPLV